MRPGQRLLRQVERQVLGSPSDHGQAHAVHGDRRADVAVGHDGAAAHHQPERSGLEHGPPLLNDPGEHPPPPVRPRRSDRTLTIRNVARLVDRREPLTHQDPRSLRAADQLRSQVQHDPVDEAFADEAPRERRAALQQHPLHVALAQVRHQLRQRHPARLVLIEGDDLGAAGCPRIGARTVDALGGGDQGRGRTVEDPGVGRDPTGRVHDDAERRLPAVRRVADRQRGIVGDHRAGARDDRVRRASEDDARRSARPRR